MMDICLIIQKQHHEKYNLPLLITAIGCAQSKDKKVVPKVVKEAFQKNIQIRR
jgi:hypothetical protein